MDTQPARDRINEPPDVGQTLDRLAELEKEIQNNQQKASEFAARAAERQNAYVGRRKCGCLAFMAPDEAWMADAIGAATASLIRGGGSVAKVPLKDWLAEASCVATYCYKCVGDRWEAS